MSSVYELRVEWPRGATTATGSRFMNLVANRGYDTEIYTEQHLATARIAELAEQGVTAKLSKSRKATDG